MKWFLTCVVVLGLVLAYALSTGEVEESSATAGADKTEAVMEFRAKDERVGERIRKLRRQVAAMESRLGELEGELRQAQSRAKNQRVAPGDDFERGQPGRPGSGTTVEEGFLQALEADESPVRAGVVQLVRDELANARAERREMRQAFRAARDEEHLEQFVKDADLTEKQTIAIEDVIAGERERVGQLFSEARKNFDFRSARQQARVIHGETDEAVAEFLGDEQLEAWREMRSKRRRGPRR